MNLIVKIPNGFVEAFTKQNICEAIGWLGAVFIHGASTPTLWLLLDGRDPSVPELNFILLIWLGCVCYLVRAFAIKDILHIWSNVVGFVINTIFLLCIVFS